MRFLLAPARESKIKMHGLQHEIREMRSIIEICTSEVQIIFNVTKFLGTFQFIKIDDSENYLQIENTASENYNTTYSKSRT